MFKVNLPGKIKEAWERMSEQRLQELLIGQKALLDKMAMAEEADVLDRAVLKRAKTWQIETGISVMDADVDIKGKVSFNSTIYDPEFDVVVVITRKGFLGFRRAYFGKVRVKGKLPNLEFEILGRNNTIKPKDIDLKKYAAFALLPAIQFSIYKPIAMEILARRGGR